MKTKLFITLLALIASTAILSAQPRQNCGCGRHCNNGKGIAWVDKNNNGICDNYENRKTTADARPGNGWGQCNGQGNRRGNGRNYVDNNNNKVCDNFEARNKK